MFPKENTTGFLNLFLSFISLFSIKSDAIADPPPEFIRIIEDLGLELDIPLRKGVLFGMSGPSYETPAEIRMIRTLGGDTANMSTIPEVIVAGQAGIRVCGISCITNFAAGLSPQPLSHEDVTLVANQVKEKFTKLIKALILRLDKSE